MSLTSHLFWAQYDPQRDTSFTAWRSRTIPLSPLHRLSLLSHSVVSSPAVLYTYQPLEVDTLPPGVLRAEAGDLFPPHNAYAALRLGHSLAHLADVVRLRAAAPTDGVVLDMDAVLLRPFPQHAGFFGSMPAKRSGGVAPQWGARHPPLSVASQQWDGRALAAFPIQVHSALTGPPLLTLASRIGHTLTRPPQTHSSAWNYVLWTIKALMARDPSSPVYPPLAFCPLPAWLPAGRCYSLEAPTRCTGQVTLFGHPLPACETILENSFTVQHFFESAYQQAPLSAATLWDTLPASCVLAQEAAHVVGPRWRALLS